MHEPADDERPTSAPEDRAFVVAEGDGQATAFVGALIISKAEGRATNGAFDLLDQRAPAGYAPPRHRHAYEDEAWYLLEGEATFWCGERELVAGRGAFVYLPRGVEHAFRVGAAGARLLTLVAPGGFARFVAEAGQALGHGELPSSVEPPDPEELARIAARYGIDITGPPPIAT